MAVPVSFFQRDMASLELAMEFGWVCGTAGGDRQEDAGDTPDTPAIKA